jgi:hypothetical protein
MLQDLVIKLNENKQPLGNEVESHPLLYTNIKAITPNATLSDERAIPAEVEQYGYGVFEWAWAPEVLHTQTAESVGVTCHEDGIFRPTFNVRASTQEELDAKYAQVAAEVRGRRNFKLLRSDITQLPQATEQMKAKAAEWEVYRQALRDIPSQEGFPWDVTFPTAPKAE